MTVVMLTVVGLLSLGAILLHSAPVAIGLLVLVFGVHAFFEEMAVTVFVHRYLTHGGWEPRSTKGQFVKFWLWWIRAGGVRFWEWVILHAWHHLHPDEDVDSYTPNATNKLTDQPPLKPPRPWTFWWNGISYRKMWNWLSKHWEEWESLVRNSRLIADVQARLSELDWARETYAKIWRGRMISGFLFGMPAVSVLLFIGGPWFLPLVPVVAAFLVALKFVLYLFGGQIINYFGHLAKGLLHHSNIPKRWMVITFWMFGEGWHWFHHEVPGSARFHPRYDPGWWTISLCHRLRFVAKAYVAEPTGLLVLYRPNKPKQSEPMAA